MLTLQVISHQKNSLGADCQASFDKQGGSIGRSLGNEWVLPDPERVVSGEHAIVVYHNGAYLLQDVSTNGVYVGDSEEAVGNGNQVELRDGDILHIGDYEILVTIGEAVPVEPFIDAPLAEDAGLAAPSAGGEPVASFDTSGFVAPPESEAGLGGDPLGASPSTLDPLAAPAGSDPLMAGPAPETAFSEADHRRGDQQFFQAPEASVERIPEDWDLNELLPDGAAEPEPSAPLPPDARIPPLDDEPSIPDDSSPFIEPSPASPPIPSAEAAAAIPPQAPLPETPPMPPPGGASQVPEPAPAANPAQALPPEAPAAAPSGGAPSPMSGASPGGISPQPPFSETPAPPQPGPAAIPPQAPPMEMPPASSPLSQPPERTASRAPSPEVPPVPPQGMPQSGRPAATVPDPPEQAPTPSATAGAADDALTAFLRGVGMDSTELERMGQAERLAMMEQVGRTYRRMVEGMLDILMARARLKREFRLDMTMIRPAENNPLKFSAGAEDALQHLLLQRSRGFMSSEQAFSEAFADLKDHEMAMVAGMRAIFNQTMERFEPERLEASFAKLGGGGLFAGLGGRESRYWGLYKQEYERLAEDARDHFLDFFGAEFARAYEEQIRGLTARREDSR